MRYLTIIIIAVAVLSCGKDHSDSRRIDDAKSHSTAVTADDPLLWPVQKGYCCSLTSGNRSYDRLVFLEADLADAKRFHARHYGAWADETKRIARMHKLLADAKWPQVAGHLWLPFVLSRDYGHDAKSGRWIEAWRVGHWSLNYIDVKQGRIVRTLIPKERQQYFLDNFFFGYELEAINGERVLPTFLPLLSYGEAWSPADDPVASGNGKVVRVQWKSTPEDGPDKEAPPGVQFGWPDGQSDAVVQGNEGDEFLVVPGLGPVAYGDFSDGIMARSTPRYTLWMLVLPKSSTFYFRTAFRSMTVVDVAQ